MNPGWLKTCVVMMLAGAPAHAFFPLEPGEVVVTCGVQGIVPTPPTNTFVLGIIDVRDPFCAPGATHGSNWPAPMYHNEFPNPTSNLADVWTEANLGSVFGLTLDDADPPNFYVTAAAVYHGAIGTGQIHRIDGVSGAISLFATLPNSGQGLGNITFDPVHGQFFVTNFEDGKIYRLDSAGAERERFDPFSADDGAPGYAPLGERVWGVAYHDDRLYFATWQADKGRPSPTPTRVWSVGVARVGGAIVGADLTSEIDLPALVPTDPIPYSSPISDIEFSAAGRMLLGERSMDSDAIPGAHTSRVLEYVGGHLAWTPSTALFPIGQFGVGENSAGGVHYDCKEQDICNGGPTVWATGDALNFVPRSYIYGIQGTSEVGGTYLDSWLVDFDGTLLPDDKTSVGEVDVYRNCLLITSCIDDFLRVADPSLTPQFGCIDNNVTLDGSASLGCAAGGLEYRWLDSSPAVVCDWSTSPLCVVPTPTFAIFTLEVRCADDPSCPATASQPVRGQEGPLVDLVPGGNFCGDVSITLDASATDPRSCPFPLEFRFRDRDGTTILQPWGTLPTHGPLLPPPGSSTYSVDVRCPSGTRPGCEASGSVTIVVTPPPVPRPAVGPPPCGPGDVTLDGSASTGCGPGGIEYRWTTPTPTVLCDWSTSPTCPTLVTGPEVITLDVRCVDDDRCHASAPIDVQPESPPTAVLAAPGIVCEGDGVTLDATGSTGACGSGLEYQFSAGATIVRPWDPSPTYGPVVPTGSTVYTLEVRCGLCSASTAHTLDVFPRPLAVATGATGCLLDPVVLDASASSSPCPGATLFAWWDGATLVRPASTDPTYLPPTTTTGTTIYTVVVACPALPYCDTSVDVAVTIRSCTLAVHYDRYGAELLTDGSVRVSWRTLSEDGTTGFVVERADEPTTGFREVAERPATGAGSSYELRDIQGLTGGGSRYRIIELTVDGVGDVTPWFEASRPTPTPTPTGRRDRPRQRAARGPSL